MGPSIGSGPFAQGFADSRKCPRLPQSIVHARLWRIWAPGLGDVALRCCCRLEGLEAVEQTMGWSARSGKIVLRIALQRLARHYDDRKAAEALVG